LGKVDSSIANAVTTRKMEVEKLEFDDIILVVYPRCKMAYAWVHRFPI
jgi:hypothetical protein